MTNTASFQSDQSRTRTKPARCSLPRPVESKDEVDRIVDRAASAGGAADPNPKQDHGFMYGRSFEDPDGHVWELVCLDMSAVPTRV